MPPGPLRDCVRYALDRQRECPLDTANGIRGALALEESGLPYTLHRIDLPKGQTKSPEFLKINPAGQIPVRLYRPAGAPVDAAYVCGPAGLLEQAEAALSDLGVPPARIRDCPCSASRAARAP